MKISRRLGIVGICLLASAATATGAAAPTVLILSPSHCRCMKTAHVSSPVKVVVTVTSFKISPANIGKPPVKGHGYLGFSLDGGKLDYPKYSGANGRLAVKLHVQGKYSPSGTPGITYSNVPDGDHTLVVFLVGNNGVKVPGRAATARVDITVH